MFQFNIRIVTPTESDRVGAKIVYFEERKTTILQFSNKSISINFLKIK